MQHATVGLLEPTFFVDHGRGHFAVAERAILTILDTFPKKLNSPSPLYGPSAVVLLVRIVTPHGERLQLVDFEF